MTGGNAVKLVFFILIISSFNLPVFSGDDRLGSLFFDKAVNEYLKGGRDDAIQSLEKSLKYSPGLENAKKLLARLLVQRAAEYFYSGEVEKSFIDIKEAKTILPKDAQVDRLYGFVKNTFDERYKPAATGKEPTSQEQKELVKYMAGAYMENNPYVSSGGQGFTRKELTYIFTGFAVGILLLFLAVLAAFDRYAAIRKQENYSQRIELERVMWAIKEGRTDGKSEQHDPAFAASLASSGLSKAPSEMERILKNSSESVRAKGLIILEAEMLAKKKSTAMNLLTPLLSDQDPLIMANAARAMCRHDLNRGMSILEKMAAGDDRQQESASLHAMGWLKNDRAAAALMKAANSRDGKIASAAVKGLKLMKDRQFAGLSPKMAAEAGRLLSLLMIK
jgi:hypothetical protein